MNNFSVGEVSSLLGLKPYVLRFWEREFSLLTPKRGNSGRRIYTDRDLHVICRIKYLLYERRYTIEGAKKRLWDEVDGENLDLEIRVREIRSEVVTLLSVLRKHKKDCYERTEIYPSA